MTLPHLAGIFTGKPLAEATRERLQAAGQPVTVHRMDLVKAPFTPVTGDDGRPVTLPPGPFRVWVVRTDTSKSKRNASIRTPPRSRFFSMLKFLKVNAVRHMFDWCHHHYLYLSL